MGVQVDVEFEATNGRLGNGVVVHDDIFPRDKLIPDDYLVGARTDNILIGSIECCYEIQKIVIGDQWVTEVRVHQAF